MADSRRGGCAANLALLVALAALALAWMAYRRSGGELATLWRDGGSAGAAAGDWDRDIPGSRRLAEPERQAALEHTRARLLARRSEVAADRDLAQVGDEVTRARRELERAFAGAGQETRGRWRELDGELDRLQTRLHAGGDAALAALDRVLDLLRSGEEDRPERRPGKP